MEPVTLRRSRLFAAATIVVLVVLSGAAAGCGKAAPPGRTASEAQIKQTVVSFQALTTAGNGAAACKLKVDQSLIKGIAQSAPPGVDDCASFWTWMGPKLPESVRQMAVNDRPAAVSIAEDRAVATMTSGARLQLVWTGERWKMR